MSIKSVKNQNRKAYRLHFCIKVPSAEKIQFRYSSPCYSESENEMILLSIWSSSIHVSGSIHVRLFSFVVHVGMFYFFPDWCRNRNSLLSPVLLPAWRKGALLTEAGCDELMPNCSITLAGFCQLCVFCLLACFKWAINILTRKKCTRATYSIGFVMAKCIS